jgi:hypothetical protein
MAINRLATPLFLGSPAAWNDGVLMIVYFYFRIRPEEETGL